MITNIDVIKDIVGLFSTLCIFISVVPTLLSSPLFSQILVAIYPAILHNYEYIYDTKLYKLYVIRITRYEQTLTDVFLISLFVCCFTDS